MVKNLRISSCFLIDTLLCVAAQELGLDVTERQRQQTDDDERRRQFTYESVLTLSYAFINLYQPIVQAAKTIAVLRLPLSFLRHKKYFKK